MIRYGRVGDLSFYSFDTNLRGPYVTMLLNTYYILKGCSVLIIFKAYIPTYFINSISCFYFFTAVPKKPSNTVPKIRFLSLDEFASIPKYMKGRLGYDNVNTSIQEFNTALGARYAFLAKGFQAMASMALKKRYKEMKSTETRDTRGVFFVVADDLKNSETLKSEASRRVIFTILRHFQLIREIRGPLSLVRYAAVV